MMHYIAETGQFRSHRDDFSSIEPNFSPVFCTRLKAIHTQLSATAGGHFSARHLNGQKGQKINNCVQTIVAVAVWKSTISVLYSNQSNLIDCHFQGYEGK